MVSLCQEKLGFVWLITFVWGRNDKKRQFSQRIITMIEGFFRNYMACEIGFGIIKRSFLQPKIIVTVVVAKLCRVTNFISTYKLGYANFSLNANSQQPYYSFLLRLEIKTFFVC